MNGLQDSYDRAWRYSHGEQQCCTSYLRGGARVGDEPGLPQSRDLSCPHQTPQTRRATVLIFGPETVCVKNKPTKLILPTKKIKKSLQNSKPFHERPLRFVFVSQRVVAGNCSWFTTQMLLWNTRLRRGFDADLGPLRYDSGRWNRNDSSVTEFPLWHHDAAGMSKSGSHLNPERHEIIVKFIRRVKYEL